MRKKLEFQMEEHVPPGAGELVLRKSPRDWQTEQSCKQVQQSGRTEDGQHGPRFCDLVLNFQTLHYELVFRGRTPLPFDKQADKVFLKLNFYNMVWKKVNFVNVAIQNGN